MLGRVTKARRSIWNGAISFGMVIIPVKLYNATDSKDISFVNLHSSCNVRYHHLRRRLLLG